MYYTVEQLQRRQYQKQGPKIVAIGGGTGLSVLLRGLKHYTDNITAIITVADDGGSSGKLRRELGVLPPGDFRNCIAALANDEALITQLFQYRFSNGGELNGHSFGNLFITAVAKVTGSFEQAIYECSRALNIRGEILPSTLKNITLFAELNEGTQTRKVEGESSIPNLNLPIERVYLEPDAPPAFPPVIQAILNADLIIAGPGSLYTSIIPNLLVDKIVSAIKVANAKKIYISNVATQPGETDNYTIDDHMRAIEKHTNIINYQSSNLTDKPGYLFNFVMANSNMNYLLPDHMSPLKPIIPISNSTEYKLIKVDVVDVKRPWCHDSVKLATQLMGWYYNKNRCDCSAHYSMVLDEYSSKAGNLLQ